MAVGDITALLSFPIFVVLFNSFAAVAQPHILHRFYLAYDHNDPVYEKEANRRVVEELFYQIMIQEDSRR